MKRLLSVLILSALVVSLIVGTTSCSQKMDIDEFNEIIVEMAKAYDRQGGQIPYEQYNSRRNIFCSPEDATAQRTMFLDCSSYVNACYREGFGVNILPYDVVEKRPCTEFYDEYARENGDNPDVIGYWDTAEYTTDESRNEVADWVYENIKVGDVVNYRRGNKGHVYIYIGDDTFMHCAGAGSYKVHATTPALSHDSNANETEGTIDTLEFDRVFRNTQSSRYIFGSAVTSFGIIRPFERGLKPTKETVARMKIAGLSMEKTSSVHENAPVYPNSELTYTITLENTGDTALTGVKIKDTLPEGTEFVSGDDGVSESGGKITWSGDIGEYATVQVNYTVKITESKAGALIVSDKTYVSDVKLGNITHSVSSVNAEKQALVAQTALDFVENGQQFESSFDMVKAIYKDRGLDLSAYSTAADALDELIDVENLTRFTSTDLSKLIAPNLYGGLSICTGGTTLESENDKTRLPKEEHLSVGDIILADWDGGETVYFYAGNSTLITVKDGVCKKLTIGDNIFVEDDNIIISLLGYNRYAVLRPSMQQLNIPDISSIAVSQQPAKVSYDIDQPFDKTGMVVSAKLDDGTEIPLTVYEISPKVFSSGDKAVTITVGQKTATVDVSVSDKKYVYNDISKLSERDIDEVVNVEGIVAGIALEGKDNDEELLIKDINDDDIIAVRDLSGTYANFYDYKVGDRISFRATVKKDTSTSTCYRLKKYLEYSSDNESQDDTIVSRDNKVTYTLSDVVEINDWEDMQNFFNKKTSVPYTMLKLNKDFYLNYYKGSDSDNYRLHVGDNATKASEIKYDGVCVCIRDDVMETNVGADWKEVLGFEKTEEFPGARVEKDIYALYIGGNNSYYQLVVLDKNWIS